MIGQSTVFAIRNYPMSIKDETISVAHGIPIAKVRKIRADLFKQEAKRIAAHRRKNAKLDAIPSGANEHERMIKGSRKLLEAIRATEFYRSN